MEYIVVGMILMLVVFLVVIIMLSGVMPTLEPLMKLFQPGR